LRRLRQVHLLLGCFFAPFLTYFALSGAWQTLRWNEAPKNQPANVYSLMSFPHVYQTMPGAVPKIERSHSFKWFAVLMSFGFIATAALGVYMAWRAASQRRLVLLCLVAGVLLPMAFMWSSLRPGVP
jgi:hypothetical protein